MPRRASHLHVRVRAVSLLIAASALATAATAPRPGAGGDPSARLASSIERATGLRLGPEGVVFERADAPGLGGAVLGRAVLFTASSREGEARDVWRALVRVSPRGSLLAMRGPVNLTTSALGDDGPLVAEATPAGSPRRVAFATRAFEQVQSASVLGPGAGRVPLRTGVTNLLTTLSWRGVERWDLRLDAPVRGLSLRFDRGALLASGDGRRWRADLAGASLAPHDGAAFARQPRVEKPLVHWAVDTVRGLSWVGPAPIAWLEETVFKARDRARRFAFRWFGVRPVDSGATAGAGAAAQEGRAIARAPRDARDPAWPPPDIAPPLARTLGRERGEGVWVDASPPWLHRQEGAPPAFVRTWLRLDPERPYTRVVLVAMDLRQVDLSMQAGVEDPVPLVGPRGEGRIPRNPEVLSRVVGAFNGAFKTEHGEYGMVVDRRVLLPPRARAATVATLDDGRVAMGTWDASPALPPSLRSLRQNLDPLVADGVENPNRRGQWGFVLGGVEHMPTMRSGLCVRAEGAALYAWGEETTARLLGRAMRLAGCAYGMHLDMNPGHAVFHFLRVDDLAARRWQHQSLVSGMRSGGERFLYHSPKDFFYLTLRPLRPPPPGHATWEPAAAQPEPRWRPSIFTARVGDVTLTSLALDRVSLRLRAGRREPLAVGDGGHDTLAPPPGAEVLGALELGVSSDAHAPRGLALDGRVLVPFAPRPGSARFELTAAGARVTTEPPGAPVDSLQGRLLLRGGAMEPVTGVAVAGAVALAVTRDGRLLVAEGATAVGALQQALFDAGASDALLVEPGALEPEWHWGDGVLDAYPATTLFALSREAPSPVARLEPLLAAAHGAVATPPGPR